MAACGVARHADIPIQEKRMADTCHTDERVPRLYRRAADPPSGGAGRQRRGPGPQRGRGGEGRWGRGRRLSRRSAGRRGYYGGHAGLRHRFPCCRASGRLGSLRRLLQHQRRRHAHDARRRAGRGRRDLRRCRGRRRRHGPTDADEEHIRRPAVPGPAMGALHRDEGGSRTAGPRKP